MGMEITPIPTGKNYHVKRGRGGERGRGGKEGGKRGEPPPNSHSWLHHCP